MRRLATGVLASAASVAVVTAAVAALKPHVPVLSLGVLYVFAVLPIAVVWGLALALPVSVASMLAFNWFFLPPTHTFQLRDGANWLALAVFLVTAFVVSALAARVRRRAETAERRERETAVLAEAAADLLRGIDLETELERLTELVSDVLGAQVRIELGEHVGENTRLLVSRRRPVATLFLAPGAEIPAPVAQRFLPAVAALLAVAVDRAGLQAEALEAETLRQSDSLKTALLRAVSHDLRSPLTAIVASAGALANRELDLDAADRESLVSTIREEAARLDRVVGNLLDLSRLQSGVTETNPQLWSVDELVGQAIDAVGHDEDRIVVELDLDSPPVRVDAAQVERVLANLIENALKFSPAGSPVVVRGEHGATELRIHVVDHGPGIPPADREAIFQPFRRSDGAGSRGAGLGLAIARGFAEANGGRLWTQDDGTGAHFVLALTV
ncbi:MAG TPA: DUF4118 domain-containing protein [Gaiellaceae bacterium]|nr:DUF4118 domain-containing protein [Gaiellaceae bacterium]